MNESPTEHTDELELEELIEDTPADNGIDDIPELEFMEDPSTVQSAPGPAFYFDENLAAGTFAAEDARPRHVTAETGASDDELQDLFRSQQRWPELIEILLGRAEGAQEAQERGQALHEAGLIFAKHMGDPQGAEMTLKAALDEWPTAPLLDDLYRVATAAGESNRICAYVGTVAAQKGGISAATLHHHLAHWHRLAGHLHDALKATQTAESALVQSASRDNSNANEAHLLLQSILQEQEEILRALERPSEVARILQQRLTMAEAQWGEAPHQDALRLSLYIESAAIFADHLADVPRAIDACMAGLDLDGNNPVLLQRLVELAQKARRPELLVDALKRRAVLLEKDSNRRTEWAATCDALVNAWKDIERHDEAANTLRHMLASDPTNDKIHSDLCALYREEGSWDRLQNALVGWAVVTPDSHDKASRHFGAGEILRNELRRHGEAEIQYRKALEAEAGHLQSMRALVTLYADGEAHDLLAAALLHLAGQSDNPTEKKNALLRAAEIYEHQLSDPQKAEEIYTWASQLDPDDPEAALRLFQRAQDNDDWATMVSLGQWLLRQSLPQVQSAAIHAGLGLGLLHTDRAQEALAHFEIAEKGGAATTPVLHHWVACLATEGPSQNWHEVTRLCGTLLKNGNAGVGTTQQNQWWLWRGQAELALGNFEEAATAFVTVLQRRPDDLEALGGLTEARDRTDHFGESIGTRWKRIALIKDPLVRAGLVIEIAAIERDKMGQPARALETLEKALAQMPQANEILHALLEHHSAGKNWNQALAMLSKLAAGAQGDVRAKYLTAAGNIYSYEKHDDARALDLFDQALDINPRDLRIFEKMDKLLNKAKDFPAQERAYRRMLKRLESVAPDDRSQKAQIMLWQGLAEIHRRRLNDPAAAAVAYEVVKSLTPVAQQAPVRRLLAQLYTHEGGDALPKAIEEHRALLIRAQNAQEAAEPLRALQQIFAQMQDFDRTYAATAGLVVLGQANGEDMDYHRRYTSRDYVLPRARLTQEIWRDFVAHPDDNQQINAIFTLTSGAVAMAHAKPAKEWGLRKTGVQYVAFEQAATKFNIMLSAVLGMQPVAFTVHPEYPEAINLVPVRNNDQLQPTLFFGAPLLQPRPEQEVAFLLGKALARTRPAHLVLWPAVVPTLTEMKSIILAAQRIAGARPVVPPDLAELVNGYTEHFTRLLPPRALEPLGAIARNLVADEAALVRWIRATVFTGNRAGLLCNNDLKTAVSLIAGENISTVSVGRFEQILDLIHFTTSHPVADLRRHNISG